MLCRRIGVAKDVVNIIFRIVKTYVRYEGMVNIIYFDIAVFYQNL